MPKGTMLYNTEKGDMVISEYGRNVQNLVNYLFTIEDKDERQKYAEQVINLFAIINPSNKHLAEYKEKLWNHMYRISKYKLDLEIPEGITIHNNDKVNLDAHLPYPQGIYNNRHYGKYIQDMIGKALAIEDPEKRKAYAEVIASYMKLAYRTWNKEHFVSDDIIIQDLKEMSKGQLGQDEDFAIENLVSLKKPHKSFSPNKVYANRNGNQNNGGNNKNSFSNKNQNQGKNKKKKNTFSNNNKLYKKP